MGGMRYQPQGRTQPNSASPIAAKLTALFAFNGNFRSALNRTGNPVITTGPNFAIGPSGYYAIGNGSGKVVTDILPAALGMQGASPRTFIVEFDLPDSSTSTNVFSFGDNSTATRSMNALQLNAGGFRTIRFDTYANDIVYSPHNVGGTAARVFLAITYDGSVTLKFRSWSYLYSTRAVVFNSQTSTLAGPMVTGNTMPLNIMGGSAYNFASMTTALYHLSMYGGFVLSDAEIFSIYQNKWQLFSAPEDDDDFITALLAGLSYTYSGVGGVALAGTSNALRGIAKTATAGINTSGSSLAARGRVSVGTVGVSFGGATSRLVGALRASAGGIIFSGNSRLSAIINTQLTDIVGSATLAFRGAGGILRNASMATVGGLRIAGSGIVSRLGQAYGVVVGTLNDVTFQKLRMMGYVGSRNDMLDENKYWRDLAGGNQTDTLNTVKKNVLRGLGYTGHLNEMEKKYWENR